MQFCPECKSIMVPSGDKLVCKRCEHEMPKKEGEHIVSKSERREREITVLEGEEAAGLPTTRVRCPECGHDTAYWWMRQLRSADESEVRFFRCTKCSKTWREYD